MPARTDPRARRLRRGNGWKSRRGSSGGAESVRTGLGGSGDGSKGVPMKLGLKFQNFGNGRGEIGDDEIVVIVPDPRGVQKHAGASRDLGRRSARTRFSKLRLSSSPKVRPPKRDSM